MNCDSSLQSYFEQKIKERLERETRKKKKRCQFVCPGSDYCMQNFFFFSFEGEGFGGNVSPFRVRYLISILRPIIRPNFHAKLHKGEKNESLGKILI